MIGLLLKVAWIASETGEIALFRSREAMAAHQDWRFRLPSSAAGLLRNTPIKA
ncbi:MAG: hypothetical protein MUF25_09160 [Pirellulaceae bacterium]|nr:hypothetical protein [Pirellulaceae bacterium]